MTLILSSSQVASLLTLDECIGAVEAAFRLHGEGRIPPPGILGLPVAGGGFHIKAALLPLARNYFAAKVNGNFSGNPQRFGMPAIQGIVFLADGVNGEPLAVMDSIEITILRTGAATAVAAKHLARGGSNVVTVCGCGNQGRVQLRALSRVLKLERAFAWDLDSSRAGVFAAELSRELGIEVEKAAEIAAAVSQSDLCVTSLAEAVHPEGGPALGPPALRPAVCALAQAPESQVSSCYRRRCGASHVSDSVPKWPSTIHERRAFEGPCSDGVAMP